MADKPTKPYITLTEIRHDGDDVEVGATIELTDGQAKQLVEIGAVEAAAPKPATKR